MAGASERILDQARRVFSSLNAGANQEDPDYEFNKLSAMVGSEFGALQLEDK